ncbi:MAG: DASS family sodium-coupled anion symporter [Saprospiraceae bacterium]|nr:DASS family sodium-coupled anion symporter [Saprospiraceae bacterium]
MICQDQAEQRNPWWFHPLMQGAFGIAVAILVYYLVPGEEQPQAPIMAAIVTLMAIWWILEVVPIPVTSLFPIVLFPLFNISDVAHVGAYYGRPIIFLFLGGFLLALGLQESGIHRRIALRVVQVIGSSPRRLILGFMVASGFLSMWISNTASVMVMLPICLSILEGVKKSIDDEKLIATFGVCLMLGIAYAADIGGMATLIGTPPNLIFLEMYSQLFPESPPIGFLEWMIMGLPLSIVFMALGWLILTHLIHKLPVTNIFEERTGISRQLEDMGPMSRDEKLSGLIFGLAAILWMTGSDIRISDAMTIHGWRSLLGLEYMSDSAVAVATATLLFLIPSKQRKGKTLLTWRRARELPWGILLLFGGGFAIAGGFGLTGLSALIGNLFSSLPSLHPLVIVAIICVFVTFLTELTSNSAITNLLLPILASATLVLEMDPKLLMIPATLSASCAFMMPIASPTQAIVFGSGYITIKQMMRTGIWFNLLGVFLIMALFTIIHLFWWS